MRRGYCLIALLAALAMIINAGAAAQDSSQAGPPATARLRAYLEAFNSGSPDKLREFFLVNYAESALKETSVEQRLGRYPATKARLRSVELKKIVAERPAETFALAKAGNGQDFLLRARVEKEPPYKLLYIFFEPTDDLDNLVIPDPKADDRELAAAVREFLETQAGADEFSGAVLVARNGRVLFHEAYGYADRDKKIPNKKDTKFNLGSINKSFTRAAILQLEKQGKLRLDDRIEKFLPDYPNREAAQKVTIRHLLDMTSGIGDFFGRRYDATPKEKIRTLQDYLPLFADLPLEFEPGSSNRYSNGGYIVLGLIIEKASGMDYYSYVRDNIFKPCGMLDTDSYARDAAIPNLAFGYTQEGRPNGTRMLNHATLPGRGSSAGGGYSTAQDMLKYVTALKEGKIFLPDIANGLGIAGGAPGISSNVEWDARSGYVVIVLTNFDPPTAGRSARRIMSWLPESE
jgi:CubicO group peptidase (beta-lactamase class C family)